MKRQTIVNALVVMGLLVLLVSSPAQASAAVPGELCDSTGGNWDGPDNFTGTCWYGLDEFVSQAQCPEGFRWYEQYENGASVDTGCSQYTLPSSDPEPASEPKGLPNSIFGVFCENFDGAGTLSMSAQKNGSINFYEGTCSGKISIGPSLPQNAASKVPEGTQATLYVRIVDENGQPTNGGYDACFDYDPAKGGTIYRFLNGAWVEQPVFFSGGQICTSASGDGVFILN